MDRQFSEANRRTTKKSRDKGIKNAVEQKKWGEVDTLLSKEHCMKFFREEQLIGEGEFQHTYIHVVENGYEELSKAMYSFFDYQEHLSWLILQPLKDNNVKFIQNIKSDALESIVLRNKWEFDNPSTCRMITSQSLKERPKILEYLSACENFPGEACLVQFMKDLQKEIKNSAEIRATKEAIQILINAQSWGCQQCEEIINNTKSLPLQEQDSLCSLLNSHVFSVPVKNARNVAYEQGASSYQISARENGNSTKKKLRDKVAPKSQEVKQEPQEASIVLEEVISDNVIEELVEKVKPIPQWFVLIDWQQSALQRLVPTPMASGYPLLKQYKTPLLLCWHSENNAHNKPFLGDAVRVDEDTFPTDDALLAEVD